MTPSLYTIPLVTLAGEPATLEPYRGRVLLIVNTASQCGFTPQFEGLESLWRQYRGQGLVVLGFPCNQFAGQEPGNSSDIKSFCSLNYGVTFPLFAKVEVNGPGTHPLFALLKQQLPGLLGSKAIKWNFTKFLVDRHGQPVRRFGPSTRPASLRKPIEALL